MFSLFPLFFMIMMTSCIIIRYAAATKHEFENPELYALDKEVEMYAKQFGMTKEQVIEANQLLSKLSDEKYEEMMNDMKYKRQRFPEELRLYAIKYKMTPESVVEADHLLSLLSDEGYKHAMEKIRNKIHSS
jgi:hypothetical protein